MDESNASGRRVVSSKPALGYAREDAWRSYLERLKSGDQDALGSLYDESSSLVYGVVRRVLDNRADAEEVVLDVYKQIWRGVQSYDEGRGTATAWLITLARSRSLDRRRATATQTRAEFPLLGETQEMVSAGNAGEAAMERGRLLMAMSTLTTEQREVVELAFFQGLTHSELAARLGLPLGTVKTRIRQGLLRMRGQLEGALQ